MAVVQSTVKGKKLTLDLNHIVLKEITIESVEVSITANAIKIADQVTKITFQSVKNIKTLRQVKMKQTALNLQQNFPTWNKVLIINQISEMDLNLTLKELKMIATFRGQLAFC